MFTNSSTGRARFSHDHIDQAVPLHLAIWADRSRRWAIDGVIPPLRLLFAITSLNGDLRGCGEARTNHPFRAENMGSKRVKKITRRVGIFPFGRPSGAVTMSLLSDHHRSSQPTLWFDVGAFMDYFRRIERPAGVLRVQMEIFAELAQTEWPRGRIGFCRIDREVDRFESVEFETLAKLFYGSPIEHSSSAREDSPHRSEPGKFWSSRFTHVVLRFLIDRHRRGASPSVGMRSFARGDILICLGASWENPRYVKLIRQARRKLGVRFAILIHDIIPITHPQLASAGHLRMFERWLRGVLAHADIIWTISTHTRAALLRLAEQRKIPIPPVETLPPGTGFHVISTAVASRADLKLPAHFVLYVSTIEIRKNHALLLRVWRHMIARHGAENVPTLVCVGRWGWLVNELSAELSEDGLHNKILTLSGLSDAEVATAYRQCLFTVFPSLMEGWGLPVSESLAHGKLCIASNRGAIPEAGGDLVDYFDPDDTPGAVAAIERAIFDRDYRLTREARIHREFRPRSWRDCAESLISRVDRLYVETGLQSLDLATSNSIPGAKRADREFLPNN